MTAADRHAADLKEARRYVRKLRDFHTLLLTAVAVIALTATIKLITSPERLWFLWVVFGLAIAIVFSAIGVFGRGHWLGPDWERRETDRRLRQLRELH
jgi:uncharacterized membrane protein YdbT with pleckstrin-like domain